MVYASLGLKPFGCKLCKYNIILSEPPIFITKFPPQEVGKSLNYVLNEPESRFCLLKLHNFEDCFAVWAKKINLKVKENSLSVGGPVKINYPKTWSLKYLLVKQYK